MAALWTRGGRPARGIGRPCVVLLLMLFAAAGCYDTGEAARQCSDRLPREGKWQPPVYPGATLGAPNAVEHEVHFETPDKPAAVINWYRDTLVAAGWHLDGIAYAADGTTPYKLNLVVGNCCSYVTLVVTIADVTVRPTQASVQWGYSMGCG